MLRNTLTFRHRRSIPLALGAALAVLIAAGSAQAARAANDCPQLSGMYRRFRAVHGQKKSRFVGAIAVAQKGCEYIETTLSFPSSKAKRRDDRRYDRVEPTQGYVIGGEWTRSAYEDYEVRVKWVGKKLWHEVRLLNAKAATGDPQMHFRREFFLTQNKKGQPVLATLSFDFDQYNNPMVAKEDPSFYYLRMKNEPMPKLKRAPKPAVSTVPDTRTFEERIPF